MRNLMVVERVDIARRAEGMAPIHVLQVGSPPLKFSDQPGGRSVVKTSNAKKRKR
jgi:hypothetical protein